MPLRVVGKDNLGRIAGICRWNRARTQIRPNALALVVRKVCIEVRQALRIIWVVHDVPEGIIIFGIFRLTFAELDDGEGIVGIGTDVGLVDKHKLGRLTNILVILGTCMDKNE